MIFRVLLLVLLLWSVPAAQKEPLTLEAIYHPKEKVSFNGTRPLGLQWLSDGEHYLQHVSGAEAPILRVAAVSGDSQPFFDAAMIQKHFQNLPGFGAKDARRAVFEGRLEVDPSEQGLLIEYARDLFYASRADGSVLRLTQSAEPEQVAQFSPNGRLVAFVRDYDLFVVDVDQGRERRLTNDGTPKRLNGILDWVYQEEIYGRGNYRAFWWSPDSRQIAFLQLREDHVPEYTVIDDIPLQPVVEVEHYPRPGDPNPTVRLGLYSVADNFLRWIDLSSYMPDDLLIVQLGWTPDSRQVVFQAQNRIQTWLDLNLADPATGQVKRLLRETTPAWVNVLGPPRWLKDGSFLWLSERSGWNHVYHYDSGGQLLGEVTAGEWDVSSLVAVDAREKWMYLTSTRDSVVDVHLYRMQLDGSGLTRISASPGIHDPRFNPEASLYIDFWSDVTTPEQVRLHQADGTVVRVIEENRVPALETFSFSTPEFVTVPARDGLELQALIIRPPGFDPSGSKKYPVLVYWYGGPDTPRARNNWASDTGVWHQYLAQQGYIVWICDNRSASGKGASPVWPIHRRLGELELRDQEDAVDWLRKQSWVDGSRIGVWGWSYGGYLAAYAVTHSDRFKIAIAGAPVTDWRLYDSIYTERYMSTPQDNPEGYDSSSVLKVAGNLQAKLLLIHGTIDDNVHVQHSLKLAHELQKADKDFEMVLYPQSRHGITQPELLYHLRKTMTRFILDNL